MTIFSSDILLLVVINMNIVHNVSFPRLFVTLVLQEEAKHEILDYCSNSKFCKILWGFFVKF